MPSLESRKRAIEHRFALVFIAAVTLVASGESAASQGVRKADIQKMSKVSGLPGVSVVSVRQGLAVAIRDRGTRTSSGVIEGVELHGEVLNPADVSDLGFASMRSRIDVDCANRRDRVVSMEVFASPGLSGAPEARPVPGGWIQPSPQAYLADVLRAMCGGRPIQNVQVASLSDDDPPMTTSVQSRPALRPAIGVTPAQAPAVQVPSPKPAPQPAAASRPAPAKAMSGSGAVAVQVAAVTTEADAQRMAQAAAKQAPKGVVARVESATVDGRGFYRALVRGFDSRADANRFCKAHMAAGGDCFVR